MADFNLEKENYNNNCIMIGVDEAGRGSWAGPIVAASCWINFQNYKLLPKDINDSKKINPKNRKKIISDLDLFYMQKIPVKSIVITGTNGKSTVCKLTQHIFKANRLDAQLGGNIGKPVLDLRIKKTKSLKHII